MLFKWNSEIVLALIFMKFSENIQYLKIFHLINCFALSTEIIVCCEWLELFLSFFFLLQITRGFTVGSIRRLGVYDRLRNSIVTLPVPSI